MINMNRIHPRTHTHTHTYAKFHNNLNPYCTKWIQSIHWEKYIYIPQPISHKIAPMETTRRKALFFSQNDESNAFPSNDIHAEVNPSSLTIADKSPLAFANDLHNTGVLFEYVMCNMCHSVWSSSHFPQRRCMSCKKPKRRLSYSTSDFGWASNISDRLIPTATQPRLLTFG